MDPLYCQVLADFGPSMESLTDNQFEKALIRQAIATLSVPPPSNLTIKFNMAIKAEKFVHENTLCIMRELAKEKLLRETTLAQDPIDIVLEYFV